MAVKTLTQSMAITPGHDVWVLPQFNESRWARTLDWYLNFQYSRGQQRQPCEMPSQLLEILEEEQIPVFETPERNTFPLMIPSQNFLPNKYTIFLSQTHNLNEWIQKAMSISQSLGSSTVRIFLPHGVVPDSVISNIKKSDVSCTLVPDKLTSAST